MEGVGGPDLVLFNLSVAYRKMSRKSLYTRKTGRARRGVGGREKRKKKKKSVIPLLDEEEIT